MADASVILKWQLGDEDFVAQAMALRNDYYIRRIIQIIAPHLLLYEMINGIATASRQNRIPFDKTLEALNNLLALGIELKEVNPLEVLDISIKYKLAAYDAAYLALAESAQCNLWTGDRSFYQAAKRHATRIMWIGDY